MWIGFGARPGDKEKPLVAERGEHCERGLCGKTCSQLGWWQLTARKIQERRNQVCCRKQMCVLEAGGRRTPSRQRSRLSTKRAKRDNTQHFLASFEVFVCSEPVGIRSIPWPEGEGETIL